MIVMKFGGTSVANFEAITRAIFIVGGRLDQKPVVVVSALSKVTDLLYKISDAAASRDSKETGIGTSPAEPGAEGKCGDQGQ